MKKSLQEVLEERVRANRLTQEESDAISLFIATRKAKRGTRDSGMMTRAWALIRAAEALHKTGKARLDTAGTDDILRLISSLRSNGYSKNYLNDIIKAVKSFLLWRIRRGAENLDEEEIREIKAPGMDWSAKKPEEMLTKEEVLQTIEACTNSRDKALISMLYDASARPVDLLTLKWKDVTFDENGAFYRTSAKTGKERFVRLTHISHPYLSLWKSDYPGETEGENLVFVSHRVYEAAGGTNTPLEITAVQRLIRTLRKKTGIQRLKPSIFRPSRITHDVADGYDLQYIMKKNWGTLKTPMIEIYAKPDEDFISNYALEKSGVPIVKKTKEKSKALQPAECPHCHAINPVGKKVCVHCGRGFDEPTLTDMIDDKIAEAVVKALESIGYNKHPDFNLDIDKRIERKKLREKIK